MLNDKMSGNNSPPHSPTSKNDIVVIDLTEDSADEQTPASKIKPARPVLTALDDREFETKRHISKQMERLLDEDLTAQFNQISLRAKIDDELEEVQNRISQLMIEKPLSPSQEDLIESALKKKLEPLDDLDRFEKILSMPRNHVHVSKFNQDITTEMLKCLRDGQWLNDEIMNFQINLMQERNSKSRKRPRVFFHNSFFYTKMMANGVYKYSNVSRWTKRKKIDIFAMDMVIFPVHVHGNHWCLGVIDLFKKEVVYYDSLGGRNPDFFTSCRRYITDEHQDKKNSSFDLTGWKDVLPKAIPHQNNGCDCGVFTLKFADYISERLPLKFSQKDMPYFRRRILLEIINGAIL